MVEKPYTRAERAAIRWINAELRVGPPVTRGLAMIVAGLVAILAALAVWQWVTPVERVYGRVESLGARGARVEVEGRVGWVRGVVFTDFCLPGDRIALTRRTALPNLWYQIDRTAGCTRAR